MILQTKVDIKKAGFEINPTDRILFVGSCFADNIGGRLRNDMFRVTVNPYGVMYNPASILHTVERAIADGTIGSDGVDVAVFTLGTNHVYILNETGEIVDNCQKRPQRLFTEKELSIDECRDYLSRAASALLSLNTGTRIIFTVSPIRYAKYGFHESQLSKATLLLAVDQMENGKCKTENKVGTTQGNSHDAEHFPLSTLHFPFEHSQFEYFPAYEIVNDELRDYRFYQADMLHPSEQAAEYILERFKDTYFSKQALQFTEEWKPIRRALNHRPFNPDSEEYKAFIAKAKADEQAFIRRWKLND